MRSSPSSTTRELVRLYSLASPGEYNLARFCAEHVAILDEVPLSLRPDADDAEVALGLAPVIGRYKATALRQRAADQRERTELSARRLLATARRRELRLELDAGELLGDLLADSSYAFIAFEVDDARVAVPRKHLLRARVPLRNFLDLVAYVTRSGFTSAGERSAAD